MKKEKIGLMLFLLGATIIFFASWVAPWFTSPVWRSAPPEHFEGTNWEVFGPIFMAMALITPAGIIMIAIGTVLLGDSRKSHIWLYTGVLMLVILSFLYPATLGYYPNLFGIAGLLIMIFFFAFLWYWAKNHRSLNQSAKISSLYQLISLIFFFLISLLLCSMLGNPFSGLYFPEKVIEQNALPFHYSFGTKVAVYFVLAMFFSFLSYYKKSQKNN